MKKIKCRCGGETELVYKDEETKGVVIKDVPFLVCTKCGEEWYPPGIPRIIEGIREAVKSIDKLKISAEKTEAHV